MFYLYIVYSIVTDRYYVGHSDNPWRRIVEHRESKGEKYTAPPDDWELKAVFEVSDNRSDAMKVEAFVKKQKSRALIERLIITEKFSRKLIQLV